jgi:uncharacterized delta-60 repeat protein
MVSSYLEKIFRLNSLSTTVRHAKGRGSGVCMGVLQAIAVTVTVLLGGMYEASAKPGALDSSFGGTGKVLVPIGNSIDHQTSSALQPDGKLVVSGYCNGGPTNSQQLLCVARFTISGALDTTFGVNGVFRGAEDNCRASGGLAILNSGHILASGIAYQIQDGVSRNRFCVTKLNSSGEIDTTFGNSGIATSYVSFSAAMLSITDLHALPDGRILLAGTCLTFALPGYYSRYQYCVTRLFADGTVDTSYGDAGSRIVFSTTSEDFIASSTLAGNHLYIAGQCSNASGFSQAMCVARIDQNGMVDTAWGDQGRYLAVFPSYTVTQASEVLLLESGKLIIAGACGDQTNRRGCLVALLADGSLDTSFGNGGLLVDSSAYPSSGYASLKRRRDAEGLIIGGRCGQSLSANSPCAWRLTMDGAADTDFADGGIAKIEFAGIAKAFSRHSINQQSNNKIVLAMSCVYPNSNEDFCLARLLHSNGYFDLDGNSKASAESDGIIFLRFLLGYSGTSVTLGALEVDADRTNGAEIATYLTSPSVAYPQCSASVVGAPGGPYAMLDGIVLIRAMLGLTGGAVTNGINFPVGTVRTNWTDIKIHLNTNCGMTLN